MNTTVPREHSLALPFFGIGLKSQSESKIEWGKQKRRKRKTPSYGNQGCWLLTKSYLTLLWSMDYRLQGSSVHGMFQARILEWVAISYSRGSSWPRDWIHFSCIGRHVLYHWAMRKALGIKLAKFFFQMPLHGTLELITIRFNWLGCPLDLEVSVAKHHSWHCLGLWSDHLLQLEWSGWGTPSAQTV